MRGSTGSKARGGKPGFAGLAAFSIKLMLGGRLYVLAALLAAVLLSGHLTMPGAVAQYDGDRLKEAQDISSIAGSVLEAYEASQGSGGPAENAEKDEGIEEALAFWDGLQRDSGAIAQSYQAMQKFKLGRPARMDENWHALYSAVLKGLEQGLIPEDSDLPLIIGKLRLMEDGIYNNARKAMGLRPLELRPGYSRGQYWRNLFSGWHYFSLAPLVILVLLLHGSFSLEEECGSAKLIRSLPAGSLRRNAARLLGQGLFAAGAVLTCILLCGLTYPAGGADHFLHGQGKLLDLNRNLLWDAHDTRYLLPSGAYFRQAGALYIILALFFVLLTMLLSAGTKNSLIALLVPVTLLFAFYMPNFMQTSLGRLPPGLTALLSPQFLMEDKAVFDVPAFCWRFLLAELAFALGILLTGRPGRRRYVDQA